MSAPKTIPRTATRQIAALVPVLTRCKVYTLDNYFNGQPVDPKYAWERLAKGAKLRDNGNGTYTVSVHSNCWYELRAA